MYNNLVEELKHVDEQTVMADISFLPVHLGSTIKAVAGLAKKKKKWKIEILEDDDGKIVVFEDELRVSVPHMYWKNFVEIFSHEIKNGDELNLNTIFKEEKRIMQEQLSKDIEELKKELASAVDGLIVEPPIRKIIEHHSVWYTLFRIKAHKTPGTVLIKGETKTEDIKKLIRRLWDAYGDDRGYLELLIDALKNKEALGSYEVFKEYTFLYGTRLQSNYNDVNIVFEASADLSFVETESVYVDNQDVLDELEGTRGIKVVKNTVFPVGPTFSPGFFTLLKKTIKDFEEIEHEEE